MMTSLIPWLCVIALYSGAAWGSLNSHERNLVLKLHNDARGLEKAQPMLPDLVWSSDLAHKAQQWTDKCHFSHQSGSTWGENIATQSSHNTRDESLEFMVGLWVKEKSHNVNGTFTECCSQMFHTCCHYTQVVWAKTTSVGCGMTHCDTLVTGHRTMHDANYLACYYSPAGNRPVSRCEYDWRPYIPQ